MAVRNDEHGHLFMIVWKTWLVCPAHCWPWLRVSLQRQVSQRPRGRGEPAPRTLLYRRLSRENWAPSPWLTGRLALRGRVVRAVAPTASHPRSVSKTRAGSRLGVFPSPRIGCHHATFSPSPGVTKPAPAWYVQPDREPLCFRGSGSVPAGVLVSTQRVQQLLPLRCRPVELFPCGDTTLLQRRTRLWGPLSRSDVLSVSASSPLFRPDGLLCHQNDHRPGRQSAAVRPLLTDYPVRRRHRDEHDREWHPLCFHTAPRLLAGEYPVPGRELLVRWSRRRRMPFDGPNSGWAMNGRAKLRGSRSDGQAHREPPRNRAGEDTLSRSPSPPPSAGLPERCPPTEVPHCECRQRPPGPNLGGVCGLDPGLKAIELDEFRHSRPVGGGAAQLDRGAPLLSVEPTRGIKAGGRAPRGAGMAATRPPPRFLDRVNRCVEASNRQQCKGDLSVLKPR